MSSLSSCLLDSSSLWERQMYWPTKAAISFPSPVSIRVTFCNGKTKDKWFIIDDIYNDQQRPQSCSLLWFLSESPSLCTRPCCLYNKCLSFHFISESLSITKSQMTSDYRSINDGIKTSLIGSINALTNNVIFLQISVLSLAATKGIFILIEFITKRIFNAITINGK